LHISRHIVTSPLYSLIISLELTMEASKEFVKDCERIYNLATVCNRLFNQVQAPVSKDREADKTSRFANPKIIDEYQQRFWAWARGQGVFAELRLSLDWKLRNHPELEELVVFLLDIIKTNLTDVHKQSIQQQNFSSRTHNAIDLKAALYGVQGALVRLQRLSITIKRASTLGESRKVKEFAKRNKNEEFESRTELLVKWMFKDIPTSLLEQFCKSVIYRYYRLLYEQQHRTRIQTERPSPVQPITESSQGQSSTKSSKSIQGVESHSGKQLPQQNTALERKEPLARGAQSIISGRSTLPPDMNLMRDEYSPPGSEISSSSAAWTSKVKYPKPPKPEPGSHFVQCPICFDIYDATKFLSLRSWR
jgi:hypothetical protein